MKQPQDRSLLPVGRVEQRIFVIREQNVMLSGDLATLYAVPAKQLNQAVKRNLDRFPEDFKFQLTWEETRALRSQLVTLGESGHFRYRPYAFTEQGVAMLASVLDSPRAIAVSIEIVRVFVRLRRLIASNQQLARRLEELERRMTEQDRKFAVVFDAIRQLMEDDEKRRRRPPIGYHTEESMRQKRRRS